MSNPFNAPDAPPLPPSPEATSPGNPFAKVWHTHCETESGAKRAPSPDALTEATESGQRIARGLPSDASPRELCQTVATSDFTRARMTASDIEQSVLKGDAKNLQASMLKMPNDPDFKKAMQQAVSQNLERHDIGSSWSKDDLLSLWKNDGQGRTIAQVDGLHTNMAIRESIDNTNHTLVIEPLDLSQAIKDIARGASDKSP